MRPALTRLAVTGMILLLAALLLVLVGAIIGREGGAWLLPLVALPMIAELVILWQQNMEWLGKFLLTTDGILCESPLSVSLLVKWEEIEDCYYLPGKTRGSGTYCLSTEKLNLRGEGKLPTAPAYAKYIKITDRAGLHEALLSRLPEILGRKLDADRMM